MKCAGGGVCPRADPGARAGSGERGSVSGSVVDGAADRAHVPLHLVPGDRKTATRWCARGAQTSSMRWSRRPGPSRSRCARAPPTEPDRRSQGTSRPVSRELRQRWSGMRARGSCRRRQGKLRSRRRDGDGSYVHPAFARWALYRHQTRRLPVAPPGFDENLGLFEGVEDLPIQEFVAQPRVEALDVSILPG